MKALATLALASLAWNTAAPTSGATFSNPALINIKDNTAATPYPSAIGVSGLSGPVADVQVTLFGFSHTFPHDVDVLLEGPANRTVELLSHAGDGFSCQNVTLTFADSAPASLGELDLITSGTWKPSQNATVLFPPPAPSGPYGTNFSVFAGLDPNATWNLFVLDDTPGDTGSIAGGWSVTITTVPEPSTIALLSLGAALLLRLTRRSPRPVSS
jgi:hypothetical protein